MPVTPGFRSFVEDQLGRALPVRSRRMFGGVGLYAGELFFGILDDDVLYLKVDDTTRPRYEAAGMHAFNPMGTPMNGYWCVPGEVLEDFEELGSWAEEAVDVARRARAGKPRAPRSPNRKGTLSRSEGE